MSVDRGKSKADNDIGHSVPLLGTKYIPHPELSTVIRMGFFVPVTTLITSCIKSNTGNRKRK